MNPLDLFWWEEPTTREREQPTNEVAEKCPIPLTSGEAFESVAQFFTLAVGAGVNIWQPKPMSLGGIGPTRNGGSNRIAPAKHPAHVTVPRVYYRMRKNEDADCENSIIAQLDGQEQVKYFPTCFRKENSQVFHGENFRQGGNGKCDDVIS